MNNLSLTNFTELTDFEKSLVLSWRNNENIRKWMNHSDIISEEIHHAFIENSKNDRTKQYYLVFSANNPIGVIYFTNITENSSELGIYANPNIRGVGNTLMNALINHANTLGISKLIAYVYITNVRAQNLYKKFNFTQIQQTQNNPEEMTILELTL